MKLAKDTSIAASSVYVTCDSCSKRVRLSKAWADLDGDPFRSYHCDRCADEEDLQPRYVDGKPVTRNLQDIVADIRRHWRKVYYAAEPYLVALATLDDIDDPYVMGSGRNLVSGFLRNSGGFRGEHARRIKAELRAMLDTPRVHRFHAPGPVEWAGEAPTCVGDLMQDLS